MREKNNVFICTYAHSYKYVYILQFSMNINLLLSLICRVYMISLILFCTYVFLTSPYMLYVEKFCNPHVVIYSNKDHHQSIQPLTL